MNNLVSIGVGCAIMLGGVKVYENKTAWMNDARHFFNAHFTEQMDPPPAMPAVRVFPPPARYRQVPQQAPYRQAYPPQYADDPPVSPHAY